MEFDGMHGEGDNVEIHRFEMSIAFSMARPWVQRMEHATHRLSHQRMLVLALRTAPVHGSTSQALNYISHV